MKTIKQDTKCPVCNFTGPVEHTTKTFSDLESTWLKCTNCGMCFIFPTPTQEELEKYYRRDYKYKKSPGAVSHLFRYSEENKHIVFREYELSLSDIGISGHILCKKKILDYGCANGTFLDYCFSNGSSKDDLFGFDIAEDLFSEVIKKQYNKLSDNQIGCFDYIFLWDVLEHISQPKILL